MNNNWNLKKLEKQASGNQEFDDYVLNISGILKYQNLNVLDIGCSNNLKPKCYLINMIILHILMG